LRACLRNPKPMVSLSTDTSSTQLADIFAPSLVEASPFLPDGAEPQLEDGMEIEVVKTASVRAETTAVPATERVPPTAQGKPSFKRASKPQVHTTMTVRDYRELAEFAIHPCARLSHFSASSLGAGRSSWCAGRLISRTPRSRTCRSATSLT
jgi:hypothetical protein